MDDLEAAFAALHPPREGDPAPVSAVPYLWQRDLFVRMCAGSLPDRLDVPTGLGKTTVIPLWLIARASGAPVPRRLVYVVDRRAVVDQATDVALALDKRLGDGTGHDPVIRSLRVGLGLAPGQRLAVSTLRGQHPDNGLWLERPEAPAIVVGTVDMIGSRLLFGGYGVSPNLRAAHAAALAIDAWLVLDEAHLVPPFEALVRAAAAMVAADIAAAGVPSRALQVLSLSATGRSTSRSVFRLEPRHLEESRVAARVRAAKRLTVHPDVPEKELAGRQAELARVRADGRHAILVYCNSRAKATEIAGLLSRSEGPDAVTLLVGERRVFERQAVTLDANYQRFHPDRDRSVGWDRPAFLVATAAGEVGVDLDADHLVCDLVAWERMVQRFGRVNRRRTPWVASIDVVPAPRSDEREDAPPGAGDLDRWRAPFQSERWAVAADETRDASPGALADLRGDEVLRALLEQATTPEVPHPALVRPVVEAWAMTSLPDHPGRPLVAPWLRGWTDEPPRSRLVWRAHLPPVGVTGRELAAFFDQAPPLPVEVLEAPTWRIVGVLRKRASAMPDDARAIVLGDTECADVVERLRNDKPDRLENDLASRTIVVHASFGGLSPEGLLDERATAPVHTLDGSAPEWDTARQDAPFVVREVQSDEDDLPGFRATWRHPQDDEETRELRVEVRRGAWNLLGDPALTRRAQVLDEHHAWTRQAAEDLTDALRLEGPVAAAVIAAAAEHDAGKVRVLWQRAMGAPATGGPWAKSDRRANPRALNGYRHEFGSLRDVGRSAAFERLGAAERELALHLVVAHHGRGRPTIRPFDPDTPPSASSALAQEVALRFHALQARWGPWGLAWWEWLVRAADWTASARNDEVAGG